MLPTIYYYYPMKRFYPLIFIFLLLACGKDPDLLPDQEVRRVLILGNSITHHQPAPEIGWYGSWGMAASASEKDYVSILRNSLQQIYPDVEVTTRIMVDFERGFWDYDFGNMADLQGMDPDILIWRLAENITETDFNTYDLAGAAEQVVTLIRNKPEMRVIFTTTFWGPDQLNIEMKRIAQKNGWELVDLYPLGFEEKYRAIGKFENEGVAIHPGDLGMQKIANMIFDQIKNCHACK